MYLLPEAYGEACGVAPDLEPRNCEGLPQALLQLLVDMWNGSLAGPADRELLGAEELGNKALPGLFFCTNVLFPATAILLLIILWVVPIRRERTRYRIWWAILVCQSWNANEVFAAVLLLANFNLVNATAATAKAACAPLTDLLPDLPGGELVEEGEACFFTSVEVLSEPGFHALLGTVALMWLSLLLVGLSLTKTTRSVTAVEPVAKEQESAFSTR